jgi:SAM-dependent methyltransferase
MIRFPPPVPGPEHTHGAVGSRLPPTPATVAAPVGGWPPGSAAPGAAHAPVVLDLSTDALKGRITILVARFTAPGSRIMGFGRAGGLLAQALAQGPIDARQVDFVGLCGGNGDALPPSYEPPARLVDAIVLDDDVMGLAHAERAELLEHCLLCLRPGGRLLLVVSDSGTELWAEGFTRDPAALGGGPPLFGDAELQVLHRQGRDLGPRPCFEFVLETPWPAWLAALPAPLRAWGGARLWRWGRHLARLRRLRRRAWKLLLDHVADD